MNEDALSRLEDVLGYHFRDRALLSMALSHSSRKNDLQVSNERLEFLGDAVLGVAVSEFLYGRFPHDTEGGLTRIKSAAVSGTTLGRVAKGMNLGAYLTVAKGVAQVPEEAQPRDDVAGTSRRTKRLPPSILADTFEAVLGAIYIDGGLQEAREFVRRHLVEEIEEAARSTHKQNFKSELQQFTQRTMGGVPEYRVTAEEGPPHVKSFEVQTVILGKPYGTGQGSSKKVAEQEAARRTLEMLGYLDAEGDLLEGE